MNEWGHQSYAQLGREITESQWGQDFKIDRDAAIKGLSRDDRMISLLAAILETLNAMHFRYRLDRAADTKTTSRERDGVADGRREVLESWRGQRRIREVDVRRDYNEDRLPLRPMKILLGMMSNGRDSLLVSEITMDRLLQERGCGGRTAGLILDWVEHLVHAPESRHEKE